MFQTCHIRLISCFAVPLARMKKFSKKKPAASLYICFVQRPGSDFWSAEKKMSNQKTGSGFGSEFCEACRTFTSCFSLLVDLFGFWALLVARLFRWWISPAFRRRDFIMGITSAMTASSMVRVPSSVEISLSVMHLTWSASVQIKICFHWIPNIAFRLHRARYGTIWLEGVANVVQSDMKGW